MYKLSIEYTKTYSNRRHKEKTEQVISQSFNTVWYVK